MSERKASSRKRFVDVICDHGIDGKVTPLSFKFEDGERVKVDKVTDVRRAPSLKAGGCGIRYTARVSAGEQSREIYLFDDEGIWFVEA
ncbi:MAG: hypothetical protein Q4D04_00925 [Clostridia bacterium]|nr:hypothetical protein [Clostridia bacterium]